jgi:hypothetical protein
MLSDDVDRKCDLRRLSPDKRQWVNCENPAAWIFRLRLQCGHRPDRPTILVCQECSDDILGEPSEGSSQRMILCARARCSIAAEIASVEPL